MPWQVHASAGSLRAQPGMGQDSRGHGQEHHHAPCYRRAAPASTWGKGTRSSSCEGTAAKRPVGRGEMGNHIPAMALIQDKPSPALPFNSAFHPAAPFHTCPQPLYLSSCESTPWCPSSLSLSCYSGLCLPCCPCISQAQQSPHASSSSWPHLHPTFQRSKFHPGCAASHPTSASPAMGCSWRLH